jgi:hypothetical protein
MKINEILTEGSDERKQAALWAQITAHEQAAKKSKDLKQQHHLKMADQLRGQLKTNDEPINEFASDDGDGSPKYIPWVDFIEGVKGIVGNDFGIKENVVKSTIKARFIPHDPMEFGPTMLYSYYETRAGGRNKGAVSTRGAIQVGKYSLGGLFGQPKDQLLTSFSLLKGHPFERHFDLTPQNISKIASIILGNTQVAYQMPEQQVNEFAPPEDNGEDDDDIELPYFDSTRKTKWLDGVSKGRKEKFVNFRAVDTGRAWAIVGDTLKDGSVKISHTPSKELAQYLVSAYLMKNSR